MVADFNLKPSIIEKEFNEIKNQIRGYVLRKDSTKPPQSLFYELDKEFEILSNKYNNDSYDINFLHAKHNYLWCKIFEFIDSDPTNSLNLFIEALRTISKRNEIRPYGPQVISNMLRTYQVPLIKIKGHKEDLKDPTLFAYLRNFVELEAHNFLIDFPEIINGLSEFLLSNYEEEIKSFKFSFQTISKAVDLSMKISGLIEIIQKTSGKKSYVQSNLYELSYRFGKKTLHFLLRFLFFEKDSTKRGTAESLLNKTVKQMIDSSTESLDIAKWNINRMAQAKRNSNEVRLMLTLKEIDVLTAKYYRETYVNKDPVKGWAQLDTIKLTLVRKSFEDGLSISKEFLRHYDEEWTLLSIFTKINMIKEETLKRKSSLSQSWEIDIFDKVSETLENLGKLFKYEIGTTNDNHLKIMSSTFSGRFSEHLILQLCQAYWTSGKIPENDNPRNNILLKEIKGLETFNEIKQGVIIIQDLPDLDIQIGNNATILVKNSKIESSEMKRIWKELEACKLAKIKRIFYAINFAKNIDTMEYIRTSFEKMRDKNEGITIEVLDIENLVNILMQGLDKDTKGKFNYIQNDIMKILDY